MGDLNLSHIFWKWGQAMDNSLYCRHSLYIAYCKGGIEMSNKHFDRRDRRRKPVRKGIDGAFSWRCCFASTRYQLDFSAIDDPCIPEKERPFRHCGC